MTRRQEDELVRVARWSGLGMRLGLTYTLLMLEENVTDTSFLQLAQPVMWEEGLYDFFPHHWLS